MQNRTRWMLLLALFTLAADALPARAQSALGWVEGQWRWENNETGCDSAYSISVSRGDKYVISSYTWQGQRDTSEYRVLAHAPGVIRARIEGEKRLDEAGEPVIWDFVQLSDDSFCWHRADWGPDDCTNRLFRCTIAVPGRDARRRPVPDAAGERRRVASARAGRSRDPSNRFSAPRSSTF
jgi:hypothetical protein